jgi:transposase
LVHHRDRLRRLLPDRAETRRVRVLVEKRRQLVDDRTAQTNRITDLLKGYFPQVLHWFDRLDTPLVGAFLERWPTLERLQAEEPEQLRAFFRQHQCRSEERIEQRIQAIGKARAMLSDAAVIEPAALMVRALCQVVAALRQGIAAIEQAIEAVVAQHSDYPIFASFPGAGRQMAPRLLAAFGSLRERFQSASEVQSYSGIAPVMARSGDTQFWVHFRWACPKFVRQTFHEFAALSIPHCPWAKQFYDRQKAKGKSHQAAIRALAFKWIRILFRCWKAGTPYEQDIYLRAIQTRAAAGTHEPVAEPQTNPVASASERPSGDSRTTILGCGSTVELQFKNTAGFWKLSGFNA